MRPSGTFDINLLLKDAGLVAASAAAQVSAANKIIDLGLGDVEGNIIIDVSACEVDTGDEIYTIGVEISSSSSFASDIYRVAALPLGDAVPLAGDVDMAAGRYILPFTNRIADGVNKRYLRLYTTIAGTIATGINYTAYIAKKTR
jgi:hypothetical protein